MCAHTVSHRLFGIRSILQQDCMLIHVHWVHVIVTCYKSPLVPAPKLDLTCFKNLSFWELSLYRRLYIGNRLLTCSMFIIVPDKPMKWSVKWILYLPSDCRVALYELISLSISQYNNQGQTTTPGTSYDFNFFILYLKCQLKYPKSCVLWHSKIQHASRS